MKYIAMLFLVLITAPVAHPCTGFFKEINGEVYFAANEDWINPYTKLWTIPGDSENYGLFVFGFSDMYPQAILNDQGLALDGFATETLEVTDTIGKQSYKGNLFLEVIKKCATVDEALEMISDYNLDFMSNGQVLIGDKTGDSALIEGDIIHRNNGSHQVATNFYLSTTNNITCNRFNTAYQMLDNENFTDEDIRTILRRTKQYKITQYSYIFNLTKGTAELFFYGDFEVSKRFNIHEEINQNSNIINIPELFENSDYNEFLLAYRMRKPRKSDEAIYDLSDYTGYYHIPEMNFELEIIESGDSLLSVMNGYEFEMIPTSDDFFFFNELDYKLYFKRKPSNRVYGVEVKQPYFNMNEFAKKRHPFLSWIYKFLR